MPGRPGLAEQVRALAYCFHLLCLADRKAPPHLPREGTHRHCFWDRRLCLDPPLSPLLTHATRFVPQMFFCHSLCVSEGPLVCMCENLPWTNLMAAILEYLNTNPAVKPSPRSGAQSHWLRPPATHLQAEALTWSQRWGCLRAHLTHLCWSLPAA